MLNQITHFALNIYPLPFIFAIRLREKHSIMCVSATHCYNLARKVGLATGQEHVQSSLAPVQGSGNVQSTTFSRSAPDYATCARNHRRQSLALLHQSYTVEPMLDIASTVSASRCTTIMLLLLAMVSLRIFSATNRDRYLKAIRNWSLCYSRMRVSIWTSRQRMIPRRSSKPRSIVKLQTS